MQNLELQVRGQEWRTQSETEATLLDEFQAKISAEFLWVDQQVGGSLLIFVRDIPFGKLT